MSVQQSLEAALGTFFNPTGTGKTFIDAMVISGGQIGVFSSDWNYNNPIEELEKHLVGLKFDIIVGNPPFSTNPTGRQRNRTPIYQKFFNVCFDLLEPGGSMAWIQPDTWRNAYVRDREFVNMRKHLAESHVHEIHLALEPWTRMGDKGVAVIVDWFILTKNRQGITSVVVGDVVSKINGINNPFDLSALIARDAGTLKSKILTVNKNAFVINRTTYPPTAGNNPIAQKHQDALHIYPVACANRFSSGAINAFAREPQLEQFTPKVIVSLIRALNPTFDPGNVAIGCDAAAFPVKSKEEAQFVIALLNSDPVQYIVAIFGDSKYSRKGKNAGKRNRGAQWLSKIDIDFSRWDSADTTFQKYFALSDSDWAEIQNTLG